MTTQSNSYSWFIGQIDNGNFHQECSDALEKISLALQDHVNAYGGKPKGRLTVTIDFKLEKGVVQIDADCAAKLPKAPASGMLVWATTDGKFSVSHPKQVEMFAPGPREVPKASAAE